MIAQHLGLAMRTRLSLRLDADLVRRAEAYGKSGGKSVSQWGADDCRLLEEPMEPGEANATPLTQSLRGVLRGTADGKADYRDHLADRDA
jgi:hypothetical protein